MAHYSKQKVKSNNEDNLNQEKEQKLLPSSKSTLSPSFSTCFKQEISTKIHSFFFKQRLFNSTDRFPSLPRRQTSKKIKKGIGKQDLSSHSETFIQRQYKIQARIKLSSTNPIKIRQKSNPNKIPEISNQEQKNLTVSKLTRPKPIRFLSNLHSQSTDQNEIQLQRQ